MPRSIPRAKIDISKFKNKIIKKISEHWKFTTKEGQNYIEIVRKEKNNEESIFSPKEVTKLILKNLINNIPELPSNIDKTFISICIR